MIAAILLRDVGVALIAGGAGMLVGAALGFGAGVNVGRAEVEQRFMRSRRGGPSR